MLTLKKSVTTLLILTSMTTIQAQTPQDALSVITTYAEDGNSVPTVADYVDLGMTEIGIHNIDAINDKIATLPQTAINTVAKIQKMIDAHNLMIHSVLNIVTGFILQNVELQVDESSVDIADATYAHGTTPTVSIPTLSVTASDGGVAVTYTLNGTLVVAGAIVLAQAGVNELVVTAVELGGDKQTKTVTVHFTETEEDAPDQPTDFNVTYTVIDGPFGKEVVPNGNIKSSDQKIDSIDVNGVNIIVDAQEYVFDGSSVQGEDLTIVAYLEDGTSETFTQ